MFKKVCLIFTGVFVLMLFSVCSYAEGGKIFFSGKDVVVDEDDLTVENQLLSPNFRSTNEEKLRVILMNRLFALDAKKNWQDPLLDKKIQIMTERYLGKLYRQRIKDSVHISDKILKSYYFANPDLFLSEPSYLLRMIVVSSGFVCEKIKSDIESGSRTFLDVVRAESMDEKSAQQDGYIGWLNKSKIPKEFALSLDGLVKGDVTDPFEYNGKWVLLEVVDFKPAKKLAFVDAKGAIKNKLVRKEVMKKTESVFEDLKLKYMIKKNI